MARKPVTERPKPAAEHPYFAIRRGAKAPRLDTHGYWSYPMFAADAGGLSYVYLVCGVAENPKKKLTAIFRPKAGLVARMPGHTVVSYTSFRHAHDPFPKEGWDKPIALFPHKGVADMKLGEFKDAERWLLAMSEAAAREFKEKKALPEEFRDLWCRLTHPILLPYVRVMAPAFFGALGVMRRA
jgi:hypothetical protein